MSYNGKTLLWLLLCFPVGLTRMWRWRCSWSVGVKALVSAPVVLALLAVLLYPEPKVSNLGSVSLYGDSKSAEVYGPAVPMGYVLPAETIAPGSFIVPEEQLVDTRSFVYASNNGKCYHLQSCDYASSASKKLTVYEAYHLGYLPCDLCGSKPYTGGFE